MPERYAWFFYGVFVIGKGVISFVPLDRTSGSTDVIEHIMDDFIHL